MPTWIYRNQYIVASGIFAGLLPALVLWGDLGLPLGFALSGLGGLGAFLILSRSRTDFDLDNAKLDAGQREAARQVLSEALADVDRLEAAGKRIRQASAKAQVAHLCSLFNRTIADVTRDPERLGSVRRLLTFYAPRAADIAEAYVGIENSPLPDAARLNRAEAALRKIDEAWAHFADKLAEPDKNNLDIELAVLDQSLKSDLEKLP
jgi:5-bromo-4-chloroindolyl phosphate hydrolysis protein